MKHGLSVSWSKSKHLSDVCVNPDLQIEHTECNSCPKCPHVKFIENNILLFWGDGQQCHSETQKQYVREHVVHMLATYFLECIPLASRSTWYLLARSVCNVSVFE